MEALKKWASVTHCGRPPLVNYVSSQSECPANYMSFHLLLTNSCSLGKHRLPLWLLPNVQSASLFPVIIVFFISVLLLWLLRWILCCLVMVSAITRQGFHILIFDMTSAGQWKVNERSTEGQMKSCFWRIAINSGLILCVVFASVCCDDFEVGHSEVNIKLQHCGLLWKITSCKVDSIN